MNGRVSVWSSQIPRPQKRHAPSAVLRQCQQSMSGPLPDFVVSGADMHNTCSEAARDDILECLSTDTEQSNGRARTHRGGAWNVEQQSNLTKVVAGAEIAKHPPLLRHRQPPGRDDEERVADVALDDDVGVRGKRDPVACFRDKLCVGGVEMLERRE